MNWFLTIYQHKKLDSFFRKLNYIITMTVFFIKFFPLKNALGKEKKESTKKSNNNFKSFPKISEKEILGIEKYLLKRWIYKKTKFQKIIKAQLKNKSYYNKKKKNYEKKMISKNFGKTFSYIIEKISEDEKLFSKNMNFNPANLRINGVQLITLQKNNGKLKKKFFIKEKNYKFLKYMNKFSIFNPDFQSCSSILSSSSEIKKITGLKDFILLDPLKAFLFQSFSSYSGCFFFENNLANRSLLGFETKKITIAESKEIEKKKSFLFRKKKFKSKKNIISKKKISVLPKKFNLKNLITKKTRQKNHFKEKSGKKIKFHSNKYYEGENKKISKANMNRINSKKKENRSFFKYISYKKISKKNFPNFLRKFKEIYLDKLNEKKKKRIGMIRFFGPKNYKTTFSVLKIKNYIKFLSIIKKRKKKKSLKKSTKFSKRFIKFKFQKIFSLRENRKSFPLRNNSFSNFSKKFISNKFLTNEGKNQHVNTSIYTKEKNIKLDITRKFGFGNEKLIGRNSFSKFREKRKYSNILHSKDSYFLLEKKGMFHLGALYSKGKLVPRSFSKAADIFTKISKLGHPQSFLQLSEFYFKGKGVFRNKKKSFTLLRNATKRGEKKSLFDLAFMQSRGLGVKLDLLKSIFYYKKIGTIRKKNKLGSKIQKKIKKSNFSKIFYQFTKNPNETDLVKIYLTSINSNRALSFPFLIFKNVHHVTSVLNQLNRLTLLSTFSSLWNLGEVFLDNRQYFLSSKKKDQILDYYPNKFTSTNRLYFSQKSPFVLNLLFSGDLIFQDDKFIHVFLFKYLGFFIKLFVDFFFYLYVFLTSKYFEFFYLELVGFYLFIFPFLYINKI